MADLPNPSVLPFSEDGRLVGARLCDFATNSDAPNPAHAAWVETYFAPTIKKHPKASLDLIGHASRRESATAADLSRRRIAAVEALVRKHHSEMKFNVRQPRGDGDAKAAQAAEGDNDAYYRAVLLRWYGVSLPTQPPEPSAPKQAPKLVAPPGCWCIVGADSFGVPVKAGWSVGTITLSLLNDKGETWKVTGIGGGPGVGVDIGLNWAEGKAEGVIGAAKKAGVAVEKAAETVKGKVAEHVMATFKDLVLKAGDLQNVVDKIKKLQLTGPSETAGPVLKRFTWESNLTIDDITRLGFFMVGMAEAQGLVLGTEIGLITFQPPGPQVGPLLVAGSAPWGFYTSLGLGTLKAALGTSITAYKIKSTTMEA